MRAKEVVRSIRLNLDEYEILKTEANIAGLTVSDYLRSRLLYQENTEEKSKHRSVMRLLVRMFGMVEAISKKDLDAETLNKLEVYSAKILQDLGYE